MKPFVNKEICPCYSIACRPIWSESVAVIVELSFADWLQNLLYALLNDPVSNCCYVERSGFIRAIILRNLVPANKGWEVVIQPVLNIFDEF